jgi:S1-C subfamily serine protease
MGLGQKRNRAPSPLAGGNSGGPVFNAAGECCGIAFQVGTHNC